MTDFRYTPRTVGAIKLHARTMAPATIAIIMRCSVGTVELICRKHGIETRDADKVLPDPPTRAERNKVASSVEIYVNDIALTIIANEARRRRTATRDLIAQMVEAIAEECFFSAILDK
jgi:hypothetical protein